MEQPETKFTPGIHRLTGDAGHPANIRLTSSSRRHVAKIYAASLEHDAECEANAHLFAAAPAMFWALVGAQSELEYWHSKYPNECGTANSEAAANALTLANGDQ